MKTNISPKDQDMIVQRASLALEGPSGKRILCPFCWLDYIRTLFVMRYCGFIGFLVLLGGGIHNCRLHKEHYMVRRVLGSEYLDERRVK